MRPFFRGPRHTTASLGSVSMNPMDITPSESDTYTGDQPLLLWCTSSPSRPSMRGRLGPQMSMSSRPTCHAWAAETASALEWPCPGACAVVPGCRRQRACTRAARTRCSCLRRPFRIARAAGVRRHNCHVSSTPTAARLPQHAASARLVLDVPHALHDGGNVWVRPLGRLCACRLRTDASAC